MSPIPFPYNPNASPAERRSEPSLDSPLAPVTPITAAHYGSDVPASPAPHPSQVRAPTDTSKGTANPASLEALLSQPARSSPVDVPGQSGAPAENATLASRAPSRALEILHAQAVRPAPCADLDAELLLVHAGTEEGAQASSWMRQVLDGASLHSARFQDNVNEQVLLLQPSLVFIHFDLPVLGLAARLVEQLHTMHPDLPIVAIGRMRNPQSTLAALRAGVKEFLDLDDTGQTAQKTVRELISSAPAAISETDTSAPLTALLAARAGTGCSLLASHLALFLQQRIHQPPATGAQNNYENAAAALDTLLIDLGYPASDCAVYLNCFGEFDFLQAVQNLRRFDRKLATAALARQAQGLRLLALPKEHGQSLPAHADTDLIVLRLRQYFRHVIADLGAVQPNELGLRVAARASQIWIVCEQTVASVVSTTHLLAQLVAQKIDQSRIQLIVNRHDPRLELDSEQIAKQLQIPLLANIPERRIQLTQAINQGTLLSASQHREPYVQELSRLTELLVKLHAQTPALKPPSGLSRLFHRHASA